jgi:diadenosine tetraphosphatase ApaH/serine/threonine PP2A family protein phosphatase
MTSLAEDHHETSAGDGLRTHTHPDIVREDHEREKFDMWNTVDQYDEKHVIKQSKQMQNIDKITGKNRRNRRVSVIRTGVVTEEEKIEHKLELPENMKLTNEHVQGLIDHFIAGEQLHLHYAQNILKALHGILSHSPNKVDVSVPKKGLLTVVGDTHGQFSDLVYILNRQKMPSKTNYYLFNGDFVDRGFFGCEVFLVLAALKIANPNYFFMNRGNHESERYNIAYGFEKEVVTKFDVKTFHLFEECFNWLPLCTVVNKSVFVVHAGLPRHTRATLKHIKHIHRNQQIPDEPQSMEDQIMQDLLWSDPVDEPGLQLSDRGAGCLFGEDITDQFLKHNKLKLIVRSHECIDEGCEGTHNNKIYTLFSASNYCGDAGNYGAIMTFKYRKHSPTEIHQYMAPILDVEKGKSMAAIEEEEERKEEEEREEEAAAAAAAEEQEQQEEKKEKRRQQSETKSTSNKSSPPPPPPPQSIANDAAMKAKLTKLNKLLDKIAEYILRYHEDLEFHFHQSDSENNGLVLLSDWTTIMSDTLQLKLQWTKLRPHLAPDGDNDHVDYRKFLGRFYIDFDGDHSFFNGVVSKIRNAIFLNGGDLHAMFEEFDEVSCLLLLLPYVFPHFTTFF